MLTAPIQLENGTQIIPDKGTPQGGIMSPLLANIVLNELDKWIESQWQNNPVTDKFFQKKNKSGSVDKGTSYRAMKRTKLKEMFIVRYADDFRIFCRTKTAAENTKIAVIKWLLERLKLEVSQDKTKVVNVKRRYSEFLGFKIKVHTKGKKQVVKSKIADKNLKHKRQKLTEQAKRIARPRKRYGELGEIRLYNSIVEGMQNYYCIATHISKDCHSLIFAVMTVLINRLTSHKRNRLVKSGRKLTDHEWKRYGKSKTLRYVAGTDEPIYPISYVKHKKPLHKELSICCYTADGRKGLHDNLRVNVPLMLALMKQPLYGRSTEYADNRISLFTAQWGKCAVTGQELQGIAEIHCHHIIPRIQNGDDKYANLVLVSETIHKLIHAVNADTILKYRSLLNLDNEQMTKLNNFREKANLFPLT